MKKRNTILLVSAVLSLIWMIFCTSTYSSSVNEGVNADTAEAVGTVIGAALMLPYMVVAWVGTIFNCVGWLISKKGFALVAAILFCVSLVIGITYGFGLIPSIVLSFVAYAKMGKAKKEAVEE